MYNNYKGHTVSTRGLKDSLTKEMTFAQRYEKWAGVLCQVDRVVKVVQENKQYVQNNEVRSWSLRRTTNSSAFLEHKAGSRNSQKWKQMGRCGPDH